MADAAQRKFDADLVWKLDRFGRSLRHLVNALAELEALGLAFVSLRDNLDLSTPSGRLMFQIIGAMAEFERSLIQERVKAGLRNARAKGKSIISDAQRADEFVDGARWVLSRDPMSGSRIGPSAVWFFPMEKFQKFCLWCCTTPSMMTTLTSYQFKRRSTHPDNAS
jgi:hypothetical protein